jgi:hypothetical protein
MSYITSRVLAALGGAVATALVAFMARGHRIPRLGATLKRWGSVTGRATWRNTNVVLYVAILAGIGVNSYQAHEIHSEANLTRTALCSYRADLIDRLRANESKVANAAILGIPVALKESLIVTVGQQRRAIQSLGGLKCSV